MYRTTTNVGRGSARTALFAVTAVLAATAGMPAAHAAPAAAPAAPPKAAVAAPPAAAPVVSAVTPQTALAQGAGCTGALGGPVACTFTATAGSVTAGGVTAPVWSFVGGTTNNPTIVVTAGQPVSITLTNSLPTSIQHPAPATTPTAVSFPLSLAVPGMLGFTSDYQGIDPAATKTYTFTPSTPGTYVYQAGHILRKDTTGAFTGGDVGPREVAMGLAGAIIVRPADFVAPVAPAPATGNTGSTLFGTLNQVPANQFDDEATLVLQDVDPAFAAAPDSYDLRAFKGKLRLINGKAYPTTDPILSGPNRKVLLRYVNAGVVSHSMGVLGARQSVVAVNGNAANGTALTGDTIAAGATEDAIVSVPATGGSGQLAVYDTSGLLDTNGAVQTGGTHRQVAFGGMMTFINTDVLGLTSDTVGPNAVINSVAPTTISNSTTPLVVTATFTDPAITINGVLTPGSAISAAQAYFDANTTTTFPLTLSGATGTVSIPGATVAALTPGTHTVFVRAQDSATPANWGPTASATFIVAVAGPTVANVTLTPSTTNGAANPSTNALGVVLKATGDASSIGSTVSLMEYTIDGGATRYPFDTATTTYGTAVVSGSTVIPWATINGLPATPNPHTVRVYATGGGVVSTAVVTAALTIDKGLPTATGITVFPTPTNGTVGSAVDPLSLQVSATLADTQSNIVGGEGFLQPATATGTPDGARTCGTATFPCTPGTGFVFVANSGLWNVPSQGGYGTIPLTQVANLANGSTFTVWVRAKDAAGNWGALTSSTFGIDKTVPAAANITATLTQPASAAVPAASTLSGPTLTVVASDAAGGVNSGISAVEWFEGTDPGVGLATPITVPTPVPTGNATLTISAAVPLTAGRTHTVSVRVRDGAGNWSAAKASNVLYVDPIFANSFGAGANGANGSGAAWNGAAAVGAPTYPVVPTTGVAANGFAMDGRFAMLTSVAAGAAGSTNSSYVTSPVIAGATNPTAATYYAKFLFRNSGPNTNAGAAAQVLTTSTTGWVNILSLRSGTTTDVVNVQYNRTAANNGRLQLSIRTATGTYSTSTPIALGADATTHTIHVGWSASATSVNITLQVDGGTVSSTPVTTGAATRVDRVRLGTIGAIPGGTTGRAYFDYFEARRNSMP